MGHVLLGLENGWGADVPAADVVAVPAETGVLYGLRVGGTQIPMGRHRIFVETMSCRPSWGIT